MPICPCQSDVENPGPHLASCPWSDPEYAPPESLPMSEARAERLFRAAEAKMLAERPS